MICYLSDIQIKLSILYFYLATRGKQSGSHKMQTVTITYFEEGEKGRSQCNLFIVNRWQNTMLLFAHRKQYVK